MKQQFSRARDRWRWVIGTFYVLNLVFFVSLSANIGRTLRIQRRGVERQAAARRDAQLPLDQFGVNVELTQYDLVELDAVLEDVRSLDLYWLRQHFSWQEIELQPGIYDWTPWDAIVQAVQRHNLSLIAVLDGPPPWAQRDDGPPRPCVPPYDPVAYARFVSAFASRFGSAIDHYQVWDEPNLSRRWGDGHVAPCAYAVLLEAAYQAIHEADLSAWVLGGGLAPTQAPGPDNLNDLIYLQQLNAFGGLNSLDILAVKPYGFWSGPDDRRVEPDVLNFSRTVAVRELMHAFGQADKPIWAVEWGWNVPVADWQGAPMPWGGDTIAVQTPRIVEAVSRARTEWPWLGPMCWAAYQPDRAADDPSWSFALRHSDGSATPLYGILDELAHRGTAGPQASVRSKHGREQAPFWLWGLLLSSLVAPWFHATWRTEARTMWQRFESLPPVYHFGLLMALAGLYVWAAETEWILLACVGAIAIFCIHPRWAIFGTILGIPFFYLAKPIGPWRIPPSETLLLLTILTMIVRHIGRKDSVLIPPKWTILDLIWGIWVVRGLVSIPAAPDSALALRAWRLDILEPALLYTLLRLNHTRHEELLSMWGASGLAVALIGIGQWLFGTYTASASLDRITSVYYSPNHLALYLERIWPLLLAWILGGCVKGRRRIWALIAALDLGGALYLTYSRGAWTLAIPAALVALAWCFRQRLRWWMLFLVLGMLMSIWLGISQSRAVPSLLQEIRVPVWQSTIEIIKDHLWLGVGLDGFRFAYPRYMRIEAWTEPLLYHPHNMWLDVTVQLGLTGLAVWTTLVIAGLAQVAQMQRNPLSWATAVGLLAGLVAALAHGWVDSGYFLTDLAWSFALVMGASQVGATPYGPSFRGQTEPILL